MVLRNQDYNMRGQLASMKFKNENSTKQIEEINENIVKQKNKLTEMGDQCIEKLDRQILEMKYKLKQVKLSESKDENKINKSDKYIKTKF